MGSKADGGASAPDPRLVDAQIKSLGVQDEALSWIMGNNKDLAPLQKEQLALGLKSAKTAYQQSQDDRQWALKKRGQLDTAQSAIIDSAASYDEGDRRATLMGEATGDITNAFGLARKQADMDLSRLGVDPSSGRALAVRGEMGVSEALAKTAAGRRATEAAHTEGLQLKGKAADMLSGYPTMATGLTTSGAGLGANGVSVANSGLAGLNSGWGTAVNAGGAIGNNASSMYGQQANHQANMLKAEGDGGAGMVVGLATAAATAY